MLYRKNIYAWEQWLRIVAGLGLAAYALLGLTHGAVDYLVAASGVIFALTGVVGWCPMCAMVGRTRRAE